jgi:hypothetical protein
MLFTDNADNNHLTKWTATAPFTSWSKEIIYDGMDLGYYEVSIDRRMLYDQRKLHIPILPWDNSDPEGGWPAFVLDATDAVALPVELTKFNAIVEDGAVHLDWETASEIDNAGFEVQRRTKKAASFEKIGFVAGNGTATTRRAYQFKDADPPVASTPITYRLKQIDRDGSSSYSAEVEVQLTTAGETKLHGNAPNPVRGSTTIRYELGRAGEVRLALYSIQGRKMRTLVDRSQSAGPHAVSLDAGQLASGVYLLRLEAANHVATKKITVVR